MRCFIFSFLFSVTLMCAVFGQTQKPPRITANIEKASCINKNDGWISFDLSLRFELSNGSNDQVFFLKDQFSLDGIEVFRRSAVNDNLESILLNQHPPSFSGDIKWLKVGEELVVSKTKSKYLTSL